MKLLTTIGVTFIGALLATAPALAQEPAAQQNAGTAQQAPQQVNAAEAMDQLEAAYQKEYAFLEAQLRDLRQRRADFDAEASRDEADKQAKIDQIGRAHV